MSLPPDQQSQLRIQFDIEPVAQLQAPPPKKNNVIGKLEVKDSATMAKLYSTKVLGPTIHYPPYSVVK